MNALAGLRILDLSGGIAAPLGVLQLAEHGADVIKVEPPGGLPDRQYAGSVSHNRSRRSVTIDLKTAAGLEVFGDLCASADVLVEAFSPGTMKRLGLGYDELSERFPRLVYCSVPAWPEGFRYADLPGWEALVHARTGQQWENTSSRNGPVFLHSPVASHGAMLLVPTGILAALVARDRTGRGQHVEISLLQGVLSLTTQNWNWTDKGQFMLGKTHPATIHQESIFECANGEWVHAATMAGVPVTRTESSLLGVEEVSFPQLLQMDPDRKAAYNETRRAAYKRWNRAELVEQFRAAGLGVEPIVAPNERFSHPQLIETGGVVEVIDPDIGSTTQLGPTLYLSATPARVTGPQPRAGAHTDEVLHSIGYTDDRVAALHEQGVI